MSRLTSAMLVASRIPQRTRRGLCPPLPNLRCSSRRSWSAPHPRAPPPPFAAPPRRSSVPASPARTGRRSLRRRRPRSSTLFRRRRRTVRRALPASSPRWIPNESHYPRSRASPSSSTPFNRTMNSTPTCLWQQCSQLFEMPKPFTRILRHGIAPSWIQSKASIMEANATPKAIS